MKTLTTIAMTVLLHLSTPAEAVDIHREAMSGGKMNAEQAEKLEVALREKPDDLSSRAKLLGYYFTAGRGAKDATVKRRAHVLWVIENEPESDLAASPYSGMRSHMDPEGYVEAKALWIKQAEAHPQDPMVLGNAGHFFLLQDRDLAEDLLTRAQEADPKNPKRADDLGQFYSLSQKEDDAAKALEQYEKAQEADEEKMSRFYRLDQLAKAALRAGEMEKAASYAEESLTEAAKYPKDWNYGNALHHGNNVLGHCALEKSDKKLASEFLIKAGQTPGSPQLNSFGPNMSLAKALMEKDEKEAVLEYFELCGKFWEMGADNLDRWTKDVKAGNVPEFGGNLRY